MNSNASPTIGFALVGRHGMPPRGICVVAVVANKSDMSITERLFIDTVWHRAVFIDLAHEWLPKCPGFRCARRGSVQTKIYNARVAGVS